MVQPINERPAFPSPPRGLPAAITTWASDMVRTLTQIAGEANPRVNELVRKANETISVTDFGAKGDGVTNDKANLQTALDKGGLIYAPSGTYLVSSGTLILKANTILFGDGIGKTIFKGGSDEQTIFATGLRDGSGVYDDVEKANITLTDFTVDASTTTRTGTGNGILFTFCSHIQVLRVKAINTGDAGIRIDGYGATFEDAAFLDSDTLATDPFTTGAASSTTVTVNHLRHRLNNNGLVTFAGTVGPIDGIPASEFNAEHSITVVDDNSYTIETTTGATAGSVSGGGSAVIASNPRHSTRWGQSRPYSFRDCEVADCYIGLEVAGGAREGLIKGNRVKHTTLHTYHLSSAFGCSVIANASDGGDNGLWIDRSRDVFAAGNDFKNLAKHGIPIGRLDGGTFRDNVADLDTPATFGLLVDGFQATSVGIQDVTIDSNRVNGVGEIDLRGGSKRVRIINNTASLDVVRVNNEDIVVRDNIGVLVQAGSLDLFAKRFGGNVDVQQHIQTTTDVPARYANIVPVRMFFKGVPANSEEMFRHIFEEETYFAIDFANSVGSIGVTATATTTLVVKKNGSNVGTIAISTGGAFTFTLATATPFSANDTLEIVGPASADATAADITVVLR